jgi:hypothetical protein
MLQKFSCFLSLRYSLQEALSSVFGQPESVSDFCVTISDMANTWISAHVVSVTGVEGLQLASYVVSVTGVAAYSLLAP